MTSHDYSDLTLACIYLTPLFSHYYVTRDWFNFLGKTAPSPISQVTVHFVALSRTLRRGYTSSHNEHQAARFNRRQSKKSASGRRIWLLGQDELRQASDTVSSRGLAAMQSYMAGQVGTIAEPSWTPAAGIGPLACMLALMCR